MNNPANFPITNGNLLKAVPWFVVEPFEANAMEHMAKPLRLIAEEGGCSVLELVSIVTGHSVDHLMKSYKSDNPLTAHGLATNDGEILLCGAICGAIQDAKKGT